MILKEDRALADNPAYIDDRINVLNHGNTFAILNLWGDIIPVGKDVHGLYHCDTRFVSRLQLLLEGQRPELLSSAIKEENELLSIDLTNQHMELRGGEKLPPGMIHIHREQIIRSGCFYEQITIENYHDRPVAVKLALRFEGDFRDIFEVRGLKRAKTGKLQKAIFKERKYIALPYTGLDNIVRTTILQLSFPYEKLSENGTIIFPLNLQPRQPLYLDYSVFFKDDTDTVPGDNVQAPERLVPDLTGTRAYFPVLNTDNEQFSHWLHRAQADLVSLMADTPYGKYPYAGVPWYNTAFGRDGIITALQTLWLAPRLSEEVLRFLTAAQATGNDPLSDAEPGKIFHEMRGGEMSGLGEVPFRKYYGTIDATPLYVILAGEYYERTADSETIRDIWQGLTAALAWINDYGDIDKDGFVEYIHKAEKGLTNQAWKDSFDAVFYADGRLAEAPLALCEVQGYVYAAKMHGAKLAALMGEDDKALQYAAEAAQLQAAFNEAFWDEELCCFVLALDGDKKPCRVKSSNAGQLLFTGIVYPELAGKMAGALMQPDMFNGWGIRTVSAAASRYNPMSYHNGSVWPHDVSLIAAGFAKYGFKKEAAALMTGLFDASLFLHPQRLPELFCGFERRKGEAPTAYPVACSPQAWSVAAVFLLLKSQLGLTIDCTKKEVCFCDPYLPAYLKSVTIAGLPLGVLKADFEIESYLETGSVTVRWKNQPGDWKLMLRK